MNASWYVIDSSTGQQAGGAHTSEGAALTAMYDLVLELHPLVENPYVVEPADRTAKHARFNA